MQLIGYDPQTDFTIAPWIARTYDGPLGQHQVVVGCNIGGAVGSTISFFDIDCTIVGKMDQTGTALDNAAYVSEQTLQSLIAAAVDKGVDKLQGIDPARAISTVQVKVADDASIEHVVDDINLHVRGSWATPAKAMTTGVAHSMAGVAGTLGVLVGVVWIVAVALLVVAFCVVGRHRTREFAVLRVLGASRRQLVRIVMGESLIVGAVGAAAGVVVVGVLVAGFHNALEGALGLPFLLPGPRGRGPGPA